MWANMAKLKFRQASELPDSQAYAKAPGQLRLPPAPDVMRQVKYQNMPWEAVKNAGNSLQQIANMAFDYHIYDLEKANREEKVAQADALDDAASRMADFMLEQEKKYQDPNAYAGFVQEAAREGIPFNQYINQQQKKEQKEKISDIMALPEYSGMIENDAKLKKRFETRLANVSRSSARTIAAYGRGAESQRLNLSESNARVEAVIKIKQRAFDVGVTTKFWISRNDVDLAQQSAQVFDKVLDQVYTEFEGQFDTPEKKSAFKNYLRNHFYDSKNKLKSEVLTADLNEHQQNVVDAIKDAENIFVAKMGNLEIENLLSDSANVKDTKKALQAVQESIAGAAKEAVKNAGIKFKKDKEKTTQDITRQLQSVFLRQSPQELRNVVSYVRRRENEIKTQESQDLEIKKRDAITEIGVRSANVEEAWQRGDINATQARSQLEQITKDVHSDFKVTPEAGTPEEQVQKNYNKDLLSTLQRRTKALAGSLQIGQVSVDKSTQAEIDERIQNERIRITGEAATDLARGIDKIKLKLQAGQGRQNQRPQDVVAEIQALREEIIQKHVSDFSGLNDPFNPDTKVDTRLEKLLTSELDKIGLSDEETLSLMLQQSQIQRKTQTAANKVYKAVKAEAVKLLDRKQTPDLDLGTAVKSLNEFANNQMQTESNAWGDSDYPIIGQNLLETSEFTSQIPTIQANFQKEINRRSSQQNIDATYEAVENIIIERTDLGELGPQVRDFEDEANWLVGRDQKDVHARAIAFKFSKLVESGDMELMPARQAVDTALTRMDDMDANKMILNNPRRALELLKGEGFPKLQDAYRRRLINAAEGNVADEDAIDAFTISTYVDNHFRNIRKNLPVTDRLSELEGKIEPSRINALRGQEVYEKLLAGLSYGTSDSSIPEEYEPDRPLKYKSKAALAAIRKDFQSDAWFQSVDWETQNINSELVNKEHLGTAWKNIERQMDDTLKIRETPKTRGMRAAERYGELFGNQPPPEPANEEQALLAQVAPEVFSMLQPERMKFMEAEQLLYDPNRRPVLFSAIEFEAMDKRWAELGPDGRTKFLSGLESLAGNKAAAVLEDLDENTKIGYEMQFYGDVKFNTDAALHLHMAMVDSDEALNNRAFPSEKEDRKAALADFDDSFDSDASNGNIGSYLRNFPVSDEREARRDVIRKVAKVKMAIARDSKVELTPDNAFKAAMKDLVHDNWVLAPSGPSVKSTFQVPRERLDIRVQEKPERITDALMRHLNELSKGGQLNEAAKIIHNEDKMSFWVNAPDNSGLIAMGVMTSEDSIAGETGVLGWLATGEDFGLQAYTRLSMRPILTKNGQVIKLSWDEIGDKALREHATRRGYTLNELLLIDEGKGIPMPEDYQFDEE